MCGSGPPPDHAPDAIVDTVVVNYFLALGRFGMLAELLGGAVCVPSSVYDADDAHVIRDEALSELERGLRLHRRRACDGRLEPRLRERSLRALPHFESLPGLAAEGALVTLTMSPDELRLYAALRDAGASGRYGLLVGLGRGEAAALAIAETRRLRLATDDQDCIRVASARTPGFRPVRIRWLLCEAVRRRLIGLDEARELHASMLAIGFWDRGGLA
jgi:hypothetical protein